MAVGNAEGRSTATLSAGGGADRRLLMRWFMWGSAFLFFGQTALAGLAVFWPRKVVGFGSKIDVGPLSQFPVNSVTRFRENIAGPAPRPLDYMAVEIVNGRIVVNTGDIRQRERHLPEHVTPA